MYHVLMIEDEIGIVTEIKSRAEKWNIQIHGCTNFRDVMSDFTKLQPHLVVMDIGLPFFDGYYWCHEIRKVSNVPILFLSAISENMNMVMAMNLGGDDFVAKPFDSDVLIAKIQALLRRTYDYTSIALMLECKGAVLNLGNGVLHFEDQVIDLTKNEIIILKILLENKNQIVSREKLMNALWASDDFIDENTLTVNIGRLRKKLANYGLDGLIKTKFGAGYIIEELL